MTQITAGTAAVEKCVDELAQEAQELLVDLIRFESLAGTEHDTQQFLADWLRDRDMPAELIPADKDLESDPNYSHHSLDGHHAPNLVTHIPSLRSGRSLLLNSHTDVVPAQDPQLFHPRVEDGKIIGRGSADAKGQVVTWLLAMLAVKRAGITLHGECAGAAVVEEEVGGNGALSYIRNSEPLDVALVFEPTNLAIHPANRGAVWFKITTTGIPTHMGRWWEGQSAFENLEKVLDEVRQWDAQLVAESLGVPLFPDDPSPVHVTVGMVNAGDWPSKVPATAEAEGGVSFLPNKTLEEVKAGMRAAVGCAAQRHGISADVVFEKLQNEAYATAADHPAVLILQQESRAVRGEGEVSGFLASCDGRLFYHRGGMDTIVFGPGDLLMAHSDIESISWTQVVTAAKIVARFIINWCGVASGPTD